MNRHCKLPGIAVSCLAAALLSACGGGSNGASGSTTMYEVQAIAPSGGTIAPASMSVDSGATATFILTPASGHAVDSVSGCGGTLSGYTYTTGTITADCTVTANFVAQYTITATAGTNGTVSPTSKTVNAGGTATFTVKPASGYAVGSVTGCGGTLAGDSYTTAAINANCSVTAKFSAAFTWVSGADTTDAGGVYGTEGVAAAANVPGARDAAATWTDASGNLWLFGGFAGYAGASNPTVGNFMNDLWEYSPTSGEWTWVAGAKAAGSQAIYGTEGVAAAANVPGARSGAAHWTDAAGDFWLFGGGGPDSSGAFGFFNDLWKYSPTSGEWTWVGGSQSTDTSGVYGAEGVAAAANMPGARAGAVTWTDANGNVWLFGGDAYDSSTGKVVFLNDLWKYSPSSGEWTWMAGSSAFNASGVYGAQGVAAPGDTPGARWEAVSWIDASGNLWLFGGYGYDSAGHAGDLNDLWEYSPSSGEWTWVGGSDIANADGVYGTEGVAAAANMPGARAAAVAWTDANGNVWIFGGRGYDTATGSFRGLNDLWEYSPSSGQWAWLAGSSGFDAAGTYGTEGVAATTNMPGARAADVTWTDTNGDLWLFGGYQYDDSTNTRYEMSDLWRYPIQ